MTIQIPRFPLCLVVLITTAACSHKDVRPSTPAGISRANNRYMDLEPGWQLRIVVPLLKSGGFRAVDLSPAAGSGTLSASSQDFIGYRVFHYAIIGRKSGPVRLKLLSAEVTLNGNTNVEPHPPELPFALPTQTEHIRLVYLVRVSEADHNMAIIASRRLEVLNIFTKQFQQNPSVCGTGKSIFCAWVPAGIAVRPEKNESVS
jgi:hypothetical protein